MNMLNYGNLSDVEFEYLCQDIMQKRLDVSLRRFTPGRDGGIDLTDDVEKHNVMVQVKHYNQSPLQSLLSALKREKSKVDRIKPKQYFICCSRALTPNNIKELYSIFSGYMESDRNIITINEIEEFLQAQENEEILKKHYKLWIDSVGILQEIQNTNIFIDCEVLLSDIEKEKQLFVKTKLFEKAVECLEHNKTLFITGNPGVGKTITSKMLVLYYAAAGYRVRFTSNASDLKELKKALSRNREVKEIILVDDCFGQAYFDMKDSQNEELLSLIKYINLSQNKLLILNSRVTIFQEAKERKPALVKSLENGECKVFILDMNEMSNIEKAEIFYNHLFFNNTPSEYLYEIKKDRRYLDIIRHKNYNPRLIEFVCAPYRYRHLAASQYYAFICKHLRNPQEIWNDEYERRLLKVDRILLSTLYSLSDVLVPESILKQCFYKRIEKEADIDKTIDQFHAALFRLSEGFVRIVDSMGRKKIGVVNPSVNDYLDGRFKDNILETQSILDNCCAVQQVKRLLPETGYNQFIERILQSHEIEEYIFEESKQKNAFIAHSISRYRIFDFHYKSRLQSYLDSPVSLYLKEYSEVDCLEIMKGLLDVEICEFYKLDEYIREKVNLDTLFKIFDLEELIVLINRLNPIFTGEKRCEFIEKSIEAIENAIDDFANNISADEYGPDMDFAVRSASEEHYFDLDKAVSYIEEDVIDAAKYEIEAMLEQLPEDIEISKDFLREVIFCVDGAEDEIQSYMADYYSDEEYRASSEDYETEIDYMFNRD